jgi:hypothetical protein
VRKCAAWRRDACARQVLSEWRIIGLAQTVQFGAGTDAPPGAALRTRSQLHPRARSSCASPVRAAKVRHVLLQTYIKAAAERGQPAAATEGSSEGQCVVIGIQRPCCHHRSHFRPPAHLTHLPLLTSAPHPGTVTTSADCEYTVLASCTSCGAG